MNPRDIIEQFTPSCEQEHADRLMMLHYMDQYDNLLLRDNATAHFTSSAWIVNPSRTKALMVYHNIYQSWSWTGGHADGNPNFLSVAMKEAMEETSISQVTPLCEAPFSLEILPVSAHFRKGRFVVAHLHLNLTYLLTADDHLTIRNKADENSDVRWFSLEDAVSASSEPDMQVIYRKLNERLLNF